MRVVLDSNILGRAARGGSGPAAELLRFVTTPSHLLILSQPILAELGRILQYPRLRALHGLDDAGIQTYLHTIQVGATVVNPVSPTPIRTRDPDDDLVIATAIAGQAEVICTRDQHFFDLSVQSACAAHGLRIVTDIDLLSELRRGAAASPGANP